MKHKPITECRRIFLFFVIGETGDRRDKGPTKKVLSL